MGVEVIYSPVFVDRFGEWFQARSDVVDYVFLSRPHVADRYLNVLKQAGHAKILYYGHDLHFLRMKKAKDLAPDSVSDPDIESMHRLELSVCQRCDVVFFPNHEEVEWARHNVPQSTAWN